MQVSIEKILISSAIAYGIYKLFIEKKEPKADGMGAIQLNPANVALHSHRSGNAMLHSHHSGNAMTHQHFESDNYGSPSYLHGVGSASYGSPSYLHGFELHGMRRQ